jgi:serine/threonine-protein kinase RsbW
MMSRHVRDERADGGLGATNGVSGGRRSWNLIPMHATPQQVPGEGNPSRASGERAGRVEFVHRSWPADPEQLSVIRHELARWLAPLQLTDDETADVVLAVDEAAANAVRHAYGPGTSGVVELTLWTEPGTLCVEVVDHGSWQQPAAPAAPGDARDHGRGIPLMNTMADAVLIHYDARGSRVLLRHPVPDAGNPDGVNPDARGTPRHGG